MGAIDWSIRANFCQIGNALAFAGIGFSHELMGIVQQ
jgi:hypothetical protein